MLFLRHLCTLMPRAHKPYFLVQLNCDTRADFLWRAFFLRVWNGMHFFSPWPPMVHAYSKAYGSYGCVAVVPGFAYFMLRWPHQWNSIDIAVMELVHVPLIVAAVWEPTWFKRHIMFHVDNMAVVQIVRSLKARDPLLVSLLHCLYMYSAYFQFTFSATPSLA